MSEDADADDRSAGANEDEDESEVKRCLSTALTLLLREMELRENEGLCSIMTDASLSASAPDEPSAEVAGPDADGAAPDLGLRASSHLRLRLLPVLSSLPALALSRSLPRLSVLSCDW